jgi:hypothetical protein
MTSSKRKEHLDIAAVIRSGVPNPNLRAEVRALLLAGREAELGEVASELANGASPEKRDRSLSILWMTIRKACESLGRPFLTVKLGTDGCYVVAPSKATSRRKTHEDELNRIVDELGYVGIDCTIEERWDVLERVAEALGLEL